MKKTILLSVALLLAGAAHAGDRVNGEALVKKANCAACHGADMKSPVAPDYPKLAGQHADYLFFSLLAYTMPNNPSAGRSNAIMQGQVSANPAITDKDGKPRPFTRSELQDIAAYISRMPGDLVLKK